MVLLMVLTVFAVCLLIDWVVGRGDRPRRESVPASGSGGAPLGPVERAADLRWHADLAYHPAHTWALPLGPHRVRVGIDDLAGRLLAPVDGLDLPRIGQRLVQGRPGWSLRCGGRRVPLLSPVSGSVCAVNSGAAVTPHIVADDPYGKGWLLEVDADDLRGNLNNLLPAPLVRAWLERGRTRLCQTRSPRPTAAGAEADAWLTQAVCELLATEVSRDSLAADGGQSMARELQV